MNVESEDWTMTRISITDGSGRWFDLEKSEVWHDDVSSSPGDQWSGQWLYRTVSGSYVLHDWSRRGGADRYIPITAAQAAKWLVANGHYDDVPKSQLNDMEL